MKIISVMPAATASSTAYWISGLSTMGIISLGLALVAGRKRVPIPATANTALVILLISDSSFLQQMQQFLLIDYTDPELHRFVIFASRIRARNDIIRLF